LKSTLPALSLGCISANVIVSKHDDQLWQEINGHLSKLTQTLHLDEIASLAPIAATREAYKALGKEPSRYRASAEALLRRVLSGKGLYQINTVVDINNLVSLESYFSIGLYDLARVSPPVELRAGRAGETYKGIGKDELNIESLPVLADANGPFGNPTSDSERTMIRLETKQIMMVIFSFGDPAGLEQAMTRAVHLFRNYASATELASQIL
jgi:DNA/RNA-binding domain of Phe-tRNA-synthetase-like protein